MAALNSPRIYGLLIAAIVLIPHCPSGAQEARASREKAVKFPVVLKDSGFLAGVYDVGVCLVSGQPTEEKLRHLAREGYSTVVNLRTQPEMDDRAQVPFDEPKLLAELGLEYVHIPLGNYSPESVKRFAQAIDGAKGKVLLHCTVAWRATYMWMAYLIAHRNVSADEAWKAGMNMNVTADRSALMLDSDVSYQCSPRRDGARKPKSGVISKLGHKLTITSPVAINPPTSNFRDFVLWDLGDILNAGQPDEKRFRELAAQGVKTIVNLRADQEMESVKRSGFDEEAVARQLGLKYISIPVQGWQTFTPANLALIADAFEKADGRVLFHCQSATRTTQALVPYLVKYQGMSLDEATKIGESMRWQTMLQELLGADISHTLKPRGALAPGARG